MIGYIIVVDVVIASLSLNVVSNVRSINSLVVYSILTRSVPAILCRGLQCVAVGRILAGVNEEYVRLIIIIADVDVVACSLSQSLLNVEGSGLSDCCAAFNLRTVEGAVQQNALLEGLRSTLAVDCVEGSNAVSINGVLNDVALLSRSGILLNLQGYGFLTVPSIVGNILGAICINSRVAGEDVSIGSVGTAWQALSAHISQNNLSIVDAVALVAQYNRTEALLVAPALHGLTGLYRELVLSTGLVANKYNCVVVDVLGVAAGHAVVLNVIGSSNVYMLIAGRVYAIGNGLQLVAVARLGVGYQSKGRIIVLISINDRHGIVIITICISIPLSIALQGNSLSLAISKQQFSLLSIAFLVGLQNCSYVGSTCVSIVAPYNITCIYNNGHSCIKLQIGAISSVIDSSLVPGTIDLDLITIIGGFLLSRGNLAGNGIQLGYAKVAVRGVLVRSYCNIVVLSNVGRIGCIVFFQLGLELVRIVRATQVGNVDVILANIGNLCQSVALNGEQADLVGIVVGDSLSCKSLSQTRCIGFQISLDAGILNVLARTRRNGRTINLYRVGRSNGVLGVVELNLVAIISKSSRTPESTRLESVRANTP